MFTRSAFGKGQRASDGISRPFFGSNNTTTSLQRLGSPGLYLNTTGKEYDENRSSGLYPVSTPIWDESPQSAENLEDCPSSIAWRECIQDLTTGEKELFLDNQFESVDELVATLQSAADAQSDRSRTLAIANKLKPIADAVNLYSGMAQTLAQNGPAPSALVLGGISCILALPERYAGYQKNLSEVLSQMGKKLALLTSHYESLHRRHEDVREALVQVFVDIVDFCRDAAKLLYNDKGGIKKAVGLLGRSLVSSFESKLGDKVIKFETDLAHFEDCVKAAVRDDATLFQNSADKRLSSIEKSQRIIGSAQSAIASQFLYQSHAATVNERVHQALLIKASNAKKKTEVTEWLRKMAIDFDIDHRNKSKQRLPGTGQWLIKHQWFLDKEVRAIKATESDSDTSVTESDSGSGSDSEPEPRGPSSLIPNILSFQGKSGCGKSFLASLVIDTYCKRPSDRSSDLAGSFVYCSSMDVAKTNALRLLSSILHQLFRCLPDEVMDSVVERLFEKQKDSSQLSDEQLEEAITSVSARFKRTYIVVDGLDECYVAGDDNLSSFCSSLRRIAEAAPATRVVAFHRPGYTEMDKAFRGCRTLRVDLGNYQDIRTYISSVISDGEFRIRDNKVLLDLVGQRLTRGAEGSFLWVKLLAKTLKPARTKNQILSKLEALPRGMDEVYEKALERVIGVEDEDDKTLNLNILLWIANARRPLSREELREAIAISPGARDLDYANCIENYEGITADCGDLIMVQNGVFTLCHSSLRDYLTNLDSPHSVKDLRYRDMQRDANKILGKACVTYLMFDKFKLSGQMVTGDGGHVASDRELFKTSPFLSYATMFWADHIRNELEEEFYPSVSELATSDQVRKVILQLYHANRGLDHFRFYYSSTPLHLVALFDLMYTTKRLVEEGDAEFTNHMDAVGFTALDYGFMGSSERICAWLLEQEATQPHKPGPLSLDRGNFVRHAAANDWDRVLEALISLGYDTDEAIATRDGKTALHIAASRGSEKAVAMLIASGSNINAICHNKLTPLMEAINGNHQQIIDALLDAGADFQLNNPLHNAAKMGNRKTAERLLTLGAKVSALGGTEACTAFHVAAAYNQVETMRVLVDHGCEIDIRDRNHLTPLYAAVISGSIEAAKMLMRLGADPNVVNISGKVMLHTVAERGAAHVISFILETFPAMMSAVTTAGETALHLAVQHRRELAVERLLEEGADPNARAKNGETALHLAVKNNQPYTVKRLLGFKADTSIGGFLCGTALHYAMNFGFPGLVKALIEAGADPYAVDEKGLTVLASWRMNPQCFWELVNSAPDLARDLEAQTASIEKGLLHLAAEGGHLDILKWLLDHGADPDGETKDHNLPLHYSCDYGHVECTELLLDVTSNINAAGYHKRTPLVMAVMSNHIDIVRLLLKREPDLTLRDGDKWCAFELAVDSGNDDLVKLMLEHGADPQQADEDGNTPLHFAVGQRNQDIANRLLDLGCDGLRPDQYGFTPFESAVDADREGMTRVNCFLRRGINGCAIRDKYGFNAFSDAVINGNQEMFENLLKTQEDSNTHAELLSTAWGGPDLLTTAAAYGHSTMIQNMRLMTNGIIHDVNQVEAYRGMSPLNAAVYHGYQRSAHELVHLHKADIELADLAGRTPLLNAAVFRLPVIFYKMLEFGGDPLKRDCLGLSALDWARRNRAVWDYVDDSMRDRWIEADDSLRLPYLHRTIVELGKELLHVLPVDNINEWRYGCWRLQRIKLIGDACNELGTAAGNQDAITCYQEAFTLYDTGCLVINNRRYGRCEMCGEDAISAPAVYTCRSCVDVLFCNTCHSVWGNDTMVARQVSQNDIRRLEALEDSVRHLWVLVHHYNKTNGFEAMAFAIHTHKLDQTRKWIGGKLHEYTNLERTISKRVFARRPLAGRTFLLKLNEELNLLRQAGVPTPFGPAAKTATPRRVENLASRGETHDRLNREWLTFRFDHPFDKERPVPSCAGHELLEVPIDEIKHKHDYFKSNSWESEALVSREWLEALVSRSEASLAAFHANKQTLTQGYLQPSSDLDETKSTTGPGGGSDVLDKGKSHEGPDEGPDGKPSLERMGKTVREDSHSILDQTASDTTRLSQTARPTNPPVPVFPHPVRKATILPDRFDHPKLRNSRELYRRKFVNIILYQLDLVARATRPGTTYGVQVGRILSSEILPILGGRRVIRTDNPSETLEEEDRIKTPIDNSLHQLVRQTALQLSIADLAFKTLQVTMYRIQRPMGLLSKDENTLGVFLDKEGFMDVVRRMIPGLEYPYLEDDIKIEVANLFLDDENN